MLSAACGESTDPPIIGAVQGTVTVEGTGLDGVTVTLSGGGAGTASTSGGGNYSFPNLEAGNYTVTISGFPADVQFDQTSGTTVVATAGRAQVVDFGGDYIRTASVNGTISVNDMGIEGVSVSLSGTESASGSTGADGTFNVGNLRMGSYTVTISGYDERRYVFDPNSQPATVALGGSATVDFMGVIGELDFDVRIENMSMPMPFTFSGMLAMPLGETMDDMHPGMSYGFNFDATPGMSVSFAASIVGSDGMFFGPDGSGISLWNEDGTHVTGDVTDQVKQWMLGDNVTEATGGDLNLSDVIRVTLESIGPSNFHLKIQNISEDSDDAVSVSPGVAVVHTMPDPLFTAGMPDRGAGLAAIANMGMAGPLTAVLAAHTGITGVLGPGPYASHTGSGVLFMPGTPASAGLKVYAETGDPTMLAGEVTADDGIHMMGAFFAPVGGMAPGPALPGMAYEFTVAGRPGDMLTFATGFAQANDLFYAPGPDGIALFPDGARPFSGDVTDMLTLWDAGTELNERPGSGLSQVLRQVMPDMGTPEMEMVDERKVCFVYPDITTVADFIKVTITAK
ncbi:MAG: hypothetical protein F4187_01200 [Gemmatimonadetes bacterium]|nr:hypothetical protein [Gemmatimonadota bacterium]MYI06724.1 hypothetical protein [Gemmatimonadota bacterium]